MTEHLGQIYTLAEAAERLRTTRHAVSRAARRYGLCAIIGRDLRFTEADLVALFEAMRVKPKDTRRIEYERPFSSEADLSRRAREFVTRNKKARASKRT